MKLATDNKLPDAYIDLSFGPTWPYVRVVREFIESFCSVTFGESENGLAERISSSASELVENAVKYSIKNHEEQSGTRVRVELLQNQDDIVLEVKNFADGTHLHVLKEHMDRFNNLDVEGLQQAYCQKMIQAAEDGSTSQLGLLRILLEWQARKVALDINDLDDTPKSDNKEVAVKVFFKTES